MDTIISCNNSHKYVAVSDSNALLMENISDLISTLTHVGAFENYLRVEDSKTGERFEIRYLGKTNSSDDTAKEE